MSDVDPVTYSALCKSADITPCEAHLDIDVFSNLEAFEKRDANERVSNALVVLLSMIKQENVKVDRCDSVLIDSLINRIDEMISLQIDEIIHHPDFQSLESIWRSLAFLVERTDFSSNCAIEILDVNKDTLSQDFNESQDIT